MAFRQLLRDNAFIVAAIALPLLVAVFFLAASAVPRWTVPLPDHDLLLKAEQPYDASRSATSLDFGVRDNHVVAIVKPVAPNTYVQRWALLVVDHVTLQARQIPVAVPDRLDEGENERVTIVPELAKTTVSTAVEAPDGYALRTRTTTGGPGLVGEIFGMRSYRQRATLSGRGRAVNIELPAPFQEPYHQTSFLGWVTNDARP